MGKCFYKPPIMVDYRKCFFRGQPVFYRTTAKRDPKERKCTYETMDRRNRNHGKAGTDTP